MSLNWKTVLDTERLMRPLRATVIRAASKDDRPDIFVQSDPDSKSGHALAMQGESIYFPIDLGAVHLLLIEDDTEAARFLVKGLRESGYSVDHAADGREGLFRATEGQFDLVVTDRMLPHIDGLAIIELMRRKGLSTPVLVLSALGSVDDRVKGLKAGGDDYLTKPFAFAELLARIEALLRRRSSAPQPTRLRVEDLEFDLLARRVTRAGREIELTARELKLLEFLMRRGGQVVTRTMLLEGVWDLHFDPQSNLIDVHISRLRQAIDRGSDRPLIHTVRGSGYVLRSDS